MAPPEWEISYKLGQICSMNSKPGFYYELCFITEFSLVKYSAPRFTHYLLLSTDLISKIMTFIYKWNSKNQYLIQCNKVNVFTIWRLPCEYTCSYLQELKRFERSYCSHFNHIMVSFISQDFCYSLWKLYKSKFWVVNFRQNNVPPLPFLSFDLWENKDFHILGYNYFTTKTSGGSHKSSTQLSKG
jgi:hypothetical protein